MNSIRILLGAPSTLVRTSTHLCRVFHFLVPELGWLVHLVAIWPLRVAVTRWLLLEAEVVGERWVIFSLNALILLLHSHEVTVLRIFLIGSLGKLVLCGPERFLICGERAHSLLISAALASEFVIWRGLWILVLHLRALLFYLLRMSPSSPVRGCRVLILNTVNAWALDQVLQIGTCEGPLRFLVHVAGHLLLAFLRVLSLTLVVEVLVDVFVNTWLVLSMVELLSMVGLSMHDESHTFLPRHLSCIWMVWAIALATLSLHWPLHALAVLSQERVLGCVAAWVLGLIVLAGILWVITWHVIVHLGFGCHHSLAHAVCPGLLSLYNVHVVGEGRIVGRERVAVLLFRLHFVL